MSARVRARVSVRVRVRARFRVGIRITTIRDRIGVADHLLHELHDELVLRIRPLLLAHGGAHVVVPPLPALLAHPARQLLGDLRPRPRPVPLHELQQFLVRERGGVRVRVRVTARARDRVLGLRLRLQG